MGRVCCRCSIRGMQGHSGMAGETSVRGRRAVQILRAEDASAGTD